MQSILEKQNIQIWKDISELNNKRMKHSSIVLFILALILVLIDNNNRLTGLWNSNSAYRTLCYVHIAYLLLATFGISIKYFITTQKENIFPLIFIFLSLNICALHAGWIDQYIHGAIYVYIMSCFCISILFSIRPKVSILLYLQSYFILIYCLYINYTNWDIFLANIVNGTIILPIVLFISIMLFRYTEKEYFYKYNLEYLIKERTSELLEANNSLRLEVSKKELMQTEKVEQLTKYLTLQMELSSSNELIADIIENMPDCFYVLDNQWHFLFVNKKAEKLFLKTKDELLGQICWNIFPETQGTLLELNYQKALKDCIPITFNYLSTLHADRWYQITVFPCQFGLSVYYNDITEQRLSRKKLKESQEETVDILESMTENFLALNKEWEITYVNRASEKVFGKYRGELLGRKITEVFRVNDTALLHYHEVMNEKKSVTFEVVSEELDNKWIEVNAYPTATGGMTIFYRDITSRKIADNEIARLDRLNLVGQLASGIAHEIRNPMTTVRGYLQFLGEKPEYADRKITFDLMISELDRANAIITEFLSLAQIKKTELKSQNLNDILNNLYPLLEADAFNQDKQISFVQGEIPKLNLNGNEISQLILNLVRNGLEAMEERGSLTINSFFDRDKVVMEVRDEGCGIPPENLNKIGTPFFTTKDNGTGLGLSSCYKIAESHNAKIRINSCSRGTTFSILFPIPEKVEEQDGMIA